MTQTLRDEIEERDIGKVKQSVNYLSTNYINTYILYVITILTKWLFTLQNESLWRASKNGNIDEVRSALSNGAEIDSYDIVYVSTNYITTYIPISNLLFYVILYIHKIFE